MNFGRGRSMGGRGGVTGSLALVRTCRVDPERFYDEGGAKEARGLVKEGSKAGEERENSPFLVSSSNLFVTSDIKLIE